MANPLDATAPDAVLQTFPLNGQGPWPTVDPFLFCVHHDDDYPEGDEELGPCAPLVGRNIGMDFSGADGWSMYHGSLVPGFPQHPHRGFETISFMRNGFMDHSDSLGAAARFGRGDVQWMTAGSGIVHAEMFPLLNSQERNATELFQIWINLPASDKMVPPHFSMLWDHEIPKHTLLDGTGRPVDITVVAGQLVEGHAPATPPPHSYASRADADVHIWHAGFAEGASWQPPVAAHPDTRRVVYVFGDGVVRINGQELTGGNGAVIRCDVPVTITDDTPGAALTDDGHAAEVLILGGRPIDEPIVQYGPFVMNTKAEIAKAYDDYSETGFGGWPWAAADPNHGHEVKRFAKHADGRVEELAAT
ncbi:pirin family protein [Euzebya tangerina]|uniref:pirin family protein n=1 Tax=Euzebya tangerina TaxID=591198 RepID=UPI000E30C460|nr:pirin family protein [Euzebya tangerina]